MKLRTSLALRPRSRRFVRGVEIAVVMLACGITVLAVRPWRRALRALTAGAAQHRTARPFQMEILASTGDVTFLQGGEVLLSQLDLRARFQIRLGHNARIALRLARNLAIGLSHEASIEFLPGTVPGEVSLYLAAGTLALSLDEAEEEGEPNRVRVNTPFGMLETALGSFDASVLAEGLFLRVDRGIVRVVLPSSGRILFVQAGESLFVTPEGEAYRIDEGGGQGVQGENESGVEYVLRERRPLLLTAAEARRRAALAAEAARAKKSAIELIHDAIYETRADLENVDIKPCLKRARWPFLVKDLKLTEEDVTKYFILLITRFEKVEIELPGERHWRKEKLEIQVLPGGDHAIASYPCRVALTGSRGDEEAKVKWKDIDVTLEFQKVGEKWLAVSMDFPDVIPVWLTKTGEYENLQSGEEDK